MKRWWLDWLKETAFIFWRLLKVMIPVLLLVRVIEVLGWVEILAGWIQPLMGWVGLPGEMGLVWMSAMVSNIYTGMAVFYQVDGPQVLTVAQVSVLGTMMLLAHALPMEGAIARATGVSLWFTLVLRIGGALLLGMLLHHFYSQFSLLQQPVPLLWQPEVKASGWLPWLSAQGQTLAAALAIIASLTLLIRILRLLGVEKIIHWLLSPLLRAIGVGERAANIMVVGLTLGLSFGGGLLIREVHAGKLDGKTVFTVIAFLGVCHSLIEDTLLILLLGADLSAILWARLMFALLITAGLARLLALLPASRQHWLYRSFEQTDR